MLLEHEKLWEPSADVIESYLTPLCKQIERWLSLRPKHILFGHNHCIQGAAEEYLTGLLALYGRFVNN
jgi:hypothetical protein